MASASALGAQEERSSLVFFVISWQGHFSSLFVNFAQLEAVRDCSKAHIACACALARNEDIDTDRSRDTNVDMDTNAHKEKYRYHIDL